MCVCMNIVSDNACYHSLAISLDCKVWLIKKLCLMLQKVQTFGLHVVCAYRVVQKVYKKFLHDCNFFISNMNVHQLKTFFHCYSKKRVMNVHGADFAPHCCCIATVPGVCLMSMLMFIHIFGFCRI